MGRTVCFVCMEGWEMRKVAGRGPGEERESVQLPLELLLSVKYISISFRAQTAAAASRS